VVRWGSVAMDPRRKRHPDRTDRAPRGRANPIFASLDDWAPSFYDGDFPLSPLHCVSPAVTSPVVAPIPNDDFVVRR